MDQGTCHTGRMDSLLHNSRVKTVAAMSVLVLISCLGNLSQTAVSSILTSMTGDFGLGISTLQWATTLYMLILGITVPVTTFMMNRIALKRLVLSMTLIMIVGSAIDVLTGDFVLFVIGRALQAVCVGIIMPMMTAVIMMWFPRNRQATVMGIAGIAMGFAPSIGPTIAGAMVTVWGWRSFFVMLAIFGVVIFIASALLLDEGEPLDVGARLDLVSLLPCILGFGGLLVGFSNASTYALASPLVWAPIVVGGGGLALFLRRQKRVDHPLVDLHIFGSRIYRASFWGLNFLFSSFLGISLILPLFVEEVWGGTALQGGMSLIGATITALVFNPVAGILADRIGTRKVVTSAAVILVMGSLAAVFFDGNTPFWVIVVMQAIRSMGVSSIIGPLTTWGLADLGRLVPHGSSFGIAMRQALASMSTAVMVFLASGLPHLLGIGIDLGYILAFSFSTVLAIAVLVVCLVYVRDTPSGR